jgi:hypothetical protein
LGRVRERTAGARGVRVCARETLMLASLAGEVLREGAVWPYTADALTECTLLYLEREDVLE